MKPQVKICGITNLDDARFCAHAGADALGFIFYKSSPRYIDPSAAAEIIEQLPGYITPVGVFVNEQRSVIEKTIAATGIRIAQLSGSERPKDCQGYPVKVWKAFRIRAYEAIEETRGYPIAAAMLDGASDEVFGGSGQLPDFAIACEMKEYHPLILAGGLNPENVVKAIRTVLPFGIDLNSGIESAPGKKDHDMIRLLFERLDRLGE